MKLLIIICAVISFSVNAQSSCPLVTSNTIVSASCNTDINLTGNQNLTIGTPESGPVVITAPSNVINVTGTGNAINNTDSGTISAGDNEFGIYNGGTIETLTNSGTISAGDFDYGVPSVGIYNYGTITTLSNSSTISAGESGYGIYNSSTITTLTNSVTGTISAGINGVGIYNEGTFTTLSNSSTISAGVNAYGIANYATIETLTNSGTISAGVNDSGILNSGVGIINFLTIETLTNSGTISAGDFYAGVHGYGILNYDTIETLTNSGTISAGVNAYGIANYATIETLTNSGTISAGESGYGIENLNSIVTLNNAQGDRNAAGALTYTGNLPSNYNIIIRSLTEYGQLVVTSPSSSATFGIFTGSTVRNGTYAAVLRGVTVTELPTRTGIFGTGTWELINSSGNIWDLFLAGFFSGPTTADTQQSLVNSANALQSTYALQNAVLANSFSYDCSVFGANNVCVSAGGRNTAVSAANGLNNTSALLIAAYRIKPTLRIGAYADQNLSVSNAGSTVNLGNNTPLIGLFGAWNERLDGTGMEIKVSAAYGQKNTTVTRQVVGTSEAGTGSSNLNSQGAQITAKYGFAVLPEVLVSPYVGVRYTQNNNGGYTEATSATVTAPLTYSALNTNATTALAGVTAAYRFIPKATAFASAGVETDTNTSGGTYSAAGVTGLTPINFNPNPVKTRSTATLGAYYDIVKDQRIGITGIYRQESYQAIATTTVMATYTIGL